MNRISTKRRARLAEAGPVREQLILEIGRCEFCYRDQLKLYIPLCVHEIARGCDRLKAIDQRCATLVLCADCHPVMDRLPRAAQLALLYLSRSADYDLPAYWKLIARNSPEQGEVDLWIRRLLRNHR